MKLILFLFLYVPFSVKVCYLRATQHRVVSCPIQPTPEWGNRLEESIEIAISKWQEMLFPESHAVSFFLSGTRGCATPSSCAMGPEMEMNHPSDTVPLTTQQEAEKQRRTVAANVIHQTSSLFILYPILETTELFTVPRTGQSQWRIWTSLFGCRLPRAAEIADLLLTELARVVETIYIYLSGLSSSAHLPSFFHPFNYRTSPLVKAGLLFLLYVYLIITQTRCINYSSLVRCSFSCWDPL